MGTYYRIKKVNQFINDVGITGKHRENNLIKCPFLHTTLKNKFQERIRILTSKISNKSFRIKYLWGKFAWNREGVKQNKNLRSQNRKIETPDYEKILLCVEL